MLYEVMREVNNFFEIPSARHSGTWSIKDGSVDLPFLQTNQYFIIEGSVFNDGLHKYPETLVNEDFYGTIYPLAVPKAFLTLVESIADWKTKYGSLDSQAMSPYNSESFEGYSYSKSGGKSVSGSGNTDPSTWQGKFAGELSTWRKV